MRLTQRVQRVQLLEQRRDNRGDLDLREHLVVLDQLVQRERAGACHDCCVGSDPALVCACLLVGGLLVSSRTELYARECS